MAQGQQIGAIIFIPMISVLCQTLGLSPTVLICAALLLVSVLLAFFVKVPKSKAVNFAETEVAWDAALLTPVILMSAYFTTYMNKPDRKRNLLTVGFISVCILNAIIRGYATIVETLFQVRN